MTHAIFLTFFPAIAGIGALELFSVLKNWESPEETESSRVANLKTNATPGDLGFNLFNVKVDSDNFKNFRARELNNGRLAMIATAGIIAQELVTGKAIELPF